MHNSIRNIEVLYSISDEDHIPVSLYSLLRERIRKTYRVWLDNNKPRQGPIHDTPYDMIKVSIKDIQEAIKKLDCNKSCGSDQIYDGNLKHATLAKIVSLYTSLKKLAKRGVPGIKFNKNTGWLPIHHAALFGSVKIAEMLHARGSRLDHEDNIGDTPLHVAAQYGNKTFAEWILKEGVDISAVNNEGKMAANIAESYGQKRMSVWLRSLEHSECATSTHQEEIVPYTDVSQITSALCKAVSKGDPREVAKSLREGENSNTCMFCEFPEWWLGECQNTPVLTVAIHMRRMDVITVILEANCDTENRGDLTVTPLAFAIGRGYMDVVEQLISHGANAMARDTDETGWLPIHYAALIGSIKVAKMLQARGSSLDVTDHIGDTPLHVAAQYGHTLFVDWLLKAGININCVNRKGNKASGEAEAYGQMQMSLWLHSLEDDIVKGASGYNNQHQGGQYQASASSHYPASYTGQSPYSDQSPNPGQFLAPCADQSPAIYPHGPVSVYQSTPLFPPTQASVPYTPPGYPALPVTYTQQAGAPYSQIREYPASLTGENASIAGYQTSTTIPCTQVSNNAYSSQNNTNSSGNILAAQLAENKMHDGPPPVSHSLGGQLAGPRSPDAAALVASTVSPPSQAITNSPSETARASISAEGSTEHIPCANQEKKRVFIINYIHFPERVTLQYGEVILDEREGATKDSENLRLTFEKIGYEVNLYENLTANETNKLLDYIQRDNSLEFLLLIILSHGVDRDTFFTSDGAQLSLEQIQYRFTNKNCPQLLGKAKIILSNFCRGKNIEKLY
ncbi:unnamed protein product [Meganyctiphanes norvegica]|uniref:Caspase family p20 domain-containing protein n=1 Tax=Meganyctiphanes norvegica TaxID=48144 RepID=A0AAV2R948_MEGNR